MTTMDWSDPAAVKRYHRRTILKFIGLPVLIELLPVAALLVYARFHPISEQQRQRVRDRALFGLPPLSNESSKGVQT